MHSIRRPRVTSELAAALVSSQRAALRSGAETLRVRRVAKRIQVALFDGFEATDALAPFDVWKLASRLGADLQAELVTVTPADEVVALDGVCIRPTASFDARADVLVVPGAPEVWRAGAMPTGLREVLHGFRAQGQVLATVGSGAVFAAWAGRLQGRAAISHRAALPVLEQQGARVTHARVVDDGDLVSCGGGTSGVDLALHLVERFFGSELALSVEESMEYERHGTVWRSG